MAVCAVPGNVRENAEAFDRNHAEALAAIRSAPIRRLTLSDITVSTISVFAQLNCSMICLDRIVKRFDQPESRAVFKETLPDTHEMILKSFKDDDVVAAETGDGALVEVGTRKRKAFSNSVILKFKGYRGGVAVKIFSNGSLHVTGPVSGDEIVHVLGLVCQVLDVIYKQGATAFRVKNYYVQMINTNFTIGFTLDKEAVYTVLTREASDLTVTVPEKHPAIRVEVPVAPREFESRIGGDIVTVMVFATGSVIITGLKKWEELSVAFERVIPVLDAHIDEVRLVENDTLLTNTVPVPVRDGGDDGEEDARPAAARPRARKHKSPSQRTNCELRTALHPAPFEVVAEYLRSMRARRTP